MSIRKKPVSIKNERLMFERVMDLVFEAIATGTYRFLCEFEKDIRDDKQTKRRKRSKRGGKIAEKRTKNIAPGVAICKHGIYRCPKCVEERKTKDVGKDLPKS